MIDFDDVKILKKLGAGVFGTTYLAKYENEQYALKIQHILKKDIKKSFKSALWREIDLFKYIDKLKKVISYFL